MALKFEYILGLLLILWDSTLAGTPGYVDHGDTKGRFPLIIFYGYCKYCGIFGL